MSKYIAIFVFLFSVNSVLCEYRKEVPSLVIPGDEKEEPSLQLIKLEDREEGYENLTCKDPKSPDNTVTPLSGHTPHLGSEIKVTCDVGKHFTGKPSNITAVTVTCLPLPHPCMCMAAWETKYNYMLMYDFNCTSAI